jgi:hypothetical protein
MIQVSKAIRGDISKSVEYLRSRSKQLHDISMKIEGMKATRESRGEDTSLYPLILLMLTEFEKLDALIADAFLGLNADSSTAEIHAMTAKNDLVKLLGLMPDATDQEITEAIDDVAPIIAGYRKKKRGT